MEGAMAGMEAVAVGQGLIGREEHCGRSLSFSTRERETDGAPAACSASETRREDTCGSV